MRVLLIACLLALTGCKKDAPPAPPPYMAQEPDPSQHPQEFYKFLLASMPQTLEKVTCECCKKSLAGCYRDMFDPTVKAKCPFG